MPRDLLGALQRDPDEKAAHALWHSLDLLHLHLVVRDVGARRAEAPDRAISHGEALEVADHQACGGEETTAGGGLEGGVELHVVALGEAVEAVEVEDAGHEALPHLRGRALEAVHARLDHAVVRPEVLVVLADLAQKRPELLALLQRAGALPHEARVLVREKPQVVGHDLHALAAQLLLAPEVRVSLDADVDLALEIP